MGVQRTCPLLLTGGLAGHLGSCAGRALVDRARQGGELARWRVLRQRRPPAAPSLLAARDMGRGVPPARAMKGSRIWPCPGGQDARMVTPPTRYALL